MRDVNMGSIRSIDRAIDILEAFTVEKPSLSTEELAKLTKIPHSTVYRILCTLERRGLVQFDEKTLKYKPGVRLFQFSALVSNVLDVQQEAEELLDNLHYKTGQTVLMAIRDEDQILYIYKKEKYEGLVAHYYYTNALEEYKKANNKEKIEQTAVLLEQAKNTIDLKKVYFEIEDENLNKL